MKVEYRPIPGFDGYRVSNYGDVQSCWERIPGGRIAWRTGDTWRSMSPYDGGGTTREYLYVDLRKDGKTFKTQVHHHVLAAFVGARPLGLHGCHNDGNPRNNFVGNLRWDTVESNHADMHKHGTAIIGEKNHSCKLTDEQVHDIRRLRQRTWTLAELSDLFGVAQSTISRICNYKRRQYGATAR